MKTAAVAVVAMAAKDRQPSRTHAAAVCDSCADNAEPPQAAARREAHAHISATPAAAAWTKTTMPRGRALHLRVRPFGHKKEKL